MFRREKTPFFHLKTNRKIQTFVFRLQLLPLRLLEVTERGQGKREEKHWLSRNRTRAGFSGPKCCNYGFLKHQGGVVFLLGFFVGKKGKS